MFKKLCRKTDKRKFWKETRKKTHFTYTGPWITFTVADFSETYKQEQTGVNYLRC